MKSQKYEQRLLAILLIAVPFMLSAHVSLGLPSAITLISVVLLLWWAGALALWIRANRQKQAESAWWQDDKCSGWRGY